MRVSNSLDPDQDRHSVGPHLGPNCLQRLSADGNCLCQQGKSYLYLFISQQKHMLWVLKEQSE